MALFRRGLSGPEFAKEGVEKFYTTDIRSWGVNGILKGEEGLS
jgi:hypothetical protein